MDSACSRISETTSRNLRQAAQLSEVPGGRSWTRAVAASNKEMHREVMVFERAKVLSWVAVVQEGAPAESPGTVVVMFAMRRAPGCAAMRTRFPCFFTGVRLVESHIFIIVQVNAFSQIKNGHVVVVYRVVNSYLERGCAFLRKKGS